MTNGALSRVAAISGEEAAVDWLLSVLLGRFIRQGSLTVITAAGNSYAFGDGGGTPVAVRFLSARAQRQALLDPELRLGEAYMDGALVVERGTIADLLAILLRQERIAAPSWALPPRWRAHWRGRGRSSGCCLPSTGGTARRWRCWRSFWFR